MSWSSHPQHPKSGNFENNNNHFQKAHIKREQNPSPQPSSMDCQIDSQFTNLLTPSPQGNDTRMFFGDGSSMSVNNNHLMRFNPLTPPGLPNASFPQANFPYEMQQNQQHQNISTSQRNNHQIIETPSITPPMDETMSKSPKSAEEDDKNGDTTSGDEKLDSDVDYSAIYKPQYNSHGKMRTHKCKRCDFVAETKAGYWIHIEVHMNPAKILKCPHYPKCRFVTELKHYLEYHIRLHKNEKPFRCEKCNYRCINKSMLNSHMKSHSGLYQYHCKDCDYATKYCHSLKKHLRKYEHEPGDVLDEDGNPDPSIIVDVNGRRRGPKGRKGRTPKSSKIGMKSLLNSRSLHQKQQSITKTEIPSIQDSRLAAILMGQNRNIMNNFLPNTLANVLQHNENLQYNVVFPYLQMLAGHQAALARLAPPEKSEEDKNLDENNETNETFEISNAMDLSQTPRKFNRVEEIEEEDDMRIEINSTRSGANTPIITSSSNSKRKGRTLDLEQSSNEETNASSIDDNELNHDNKFQKVSTTSNQEISNEKAALSETSSNFSNVESLIGSTNCKTDKSLTTRKDFHKNCSRESNIPDVSELYSCKHCDIHFKSVVLHSLHMGFHSCDDVFKCNMCGEQCTTAIELFVHLARKPHNDV